MPEEVLPYVIEYTPQQETCGAEVFIPKRKAALLLTGSSPEITGHRIGRVPLNTSLVQTIDTLINHNYDFVHILGHGDLIHPDSYYGYSTLLTRDHLERGIRYLSKTLTPEDLLLVVIRGLQIDERGTFLPLFDRTDFLDFELCDLFQTIQARQIFYGSLGAFVSPFVRRERESNIMPIYVSPTKPVHSLPIESSLSSASVSSRFYRHFFCSNSFPSIYERFRTAAFRTAQEESKQGHFCAYLRHSPYAHAEKNTL